jgi:hypothetical protein
VYQADIFYTLHTKQYTDNGEILFTPNLITYHIDKNHEDYKKYLLDTYHQFKQYFLII